MYARQPGYGSTSEDGPDDPPDGSKINLTTPEEEKYKKEPTNGFPHEASFKDLFRYAERKDYLLITVGTMAAIATGGSVPVMSIVFGGISDNFIGTEGALDVGNIPEPVLESLLDDFQRQTNHSALHYCALGVFMFIAAYLQTVCWLTTCERQVNKIRQKFLYSILRQDRGWFDQHQTGTLTAALADNLDRIREGIGDKFGILLQNLAQCMIGVVIAFSYSWSLSLVMLSLSPFTIASNYFMARMISNETRREQERYAVAGSVAEEVLSCIRTVMAFNGQKREANRYETALESAKKSGVMKNVYVGIGLCVMYLTQFGAFALAFWYGSTMIVDESIETGDIFVVFFSINSGCQALGNAGPHLATVAASKGAAGAIYAIIDRTPEIDPYSQSGKKPEYPRGKIEFKDVHFSYPMRSDVKVLNGLSFSAKEGETVALVGPSGCGKSTVVSLLLRQYNPHSGQIMLDGQPVDELNVNWLRNCLGVVSQEPVLFEASVEDNIKMGYPDVTYDEMVEACQMSNAHHFISKLPEKYRTMVGQRGAQLSGGQKQRIAIARTLVREPKVLLLDEATSALDAESEFIVQQALDQAQEGRTTLVIAHRLSTIRNADKIIALDAGEIKEMGTHEELMELKGLYHDLVMAQQVRDVEDDNEAIDEKEEESQLEQMRKNPMPKLRRQMSRQESREPAPRRRTQSMRRQSSVDDNELMYNWLLGLTEDSEKETVRKVSRPMGMLDTTQLNILAEAAAGRKASESSAPDVQEPTNFRKPTRKKSVLARVTLEEMERQRLREQLNEDAAAKSNFSEIISKSRPEWCWLILGLIAASIRGMVMPAFAVFFSGMFSAYSKTGDDLKRATTLWSSLLLLLGVVQGVTVVAASVFFGIAGENITKRMRMEVWWNILRQDVTFFDNPKNSVGKLCTRLAADAPNVKTAIDFRFGVVISSLVAVGGGVALAFIFGWQLALLVLAMFPVLLIGNFLRVRTARGSQKRDNELLEEAGKIATESIENVSTVQSLTRELDIYDEFCRSLLLPYNTALKQAHIQALSFAFSVAFTFFMFAACFSFGAYLVTQLVMTPADVFRVFFAIIATGNMVGNAAAYVPEYIKARMSAGLIFRMSSIEPRIDSCEEGGLKPEIVGKIVFSDVHFTYPTRMMATVLDGLTIEVDHGKTLALVGPSGCGKSTVVSMMERFYDPVYGHINIDDFALQSINVPHLRSCIALVSQEPVLFATSIGENITYGLENASKEQIVEAAKLANIHSFVIGLPEGYDTEVGEKGTQLSGGQKQRIAIARALVRNPNILLLDEATSALDTESEKIVQEAIDRAREGRTCIVIAHRLSTVQDSDSIAVIKDGKVIEQGTHDQLVAAKGFYYSLMQKQNLPT